MKTIFVPPMQDVMRLLDQRKMARGFTGFLPRPNQANFLIATWQLTDTSGVTLPGVTLEIEIKPSIVADRGVLLLSLRKRYGIGRYRMYQLEICPKEKRSHNGNPVLYGPHEHFSELEVYGVDADGVNYDDWDGCVDWFLQRTNVENFKVERPW